MRKLFILLALVSSPLIPAYAKKDCTTAPKEKWMSEADFKKAVEAKGYKIAKFKQPGSCYEIYGTRSDGKEVEVYFDPTDAKVVKEKIED